MTREHSFITEWSNNFSPKKVATPNKIEGILEEVKEESIKR